MRGPSPLKFFHKGLCSIPTHLNHLLNASIQTRSLKLATQIHTQIITNNYTFLPFLFNNLINFYATCGCLNQALLLFSITHHHFKTIVTWTSLIAHLSRFNMPLQALSFFKQMRGFGLYPNQFTFSAVLSASAATMIILHGQQLHSLIHKHGFDGNVFVSSALVDMYAKCADMLSAEKVFGQMPERNIVSWNSMIVGFLHNNFYDRAVGVLKDVLREKTVIPNEVGVTSALSACAKMGASDSGRQVHGVGVKYGLVPLTTVKNSLMDMYFKCRVFDEGIKMFQCVGDRDVVTWNVLVMGCVQNDKFEEACNHFWVMRREGILPDEASFSTVLQSSGSLAALHQGTAIHDQIIKLGYVKNTRVLGPLITMYAKCGSLVDAYRVFEGIVDHNVISWTAMISAYRLHGCANQVIELFEHMLSEGIQPSHVTFVCVLSACSHTGRVEEGLAYFNSMKKIYDINPGPEHYACMVDLLGRAGRLYEANRFIESMPMKPTPSVLGALLGACRKHGDLKMGREVAERLFQMEPHNPGNYVLLYNMYTRNGRLEEANDVRRLMGVNGIRKEPGCSWIDVKNLTFVFTSHDRSHSSTGEIYKMLEKMEKLMKKKGYVAETKLVTNSSDENEERGLWYHSEKLALAFGLLTLPTDSPIRIKKNLRTCDHCHTVMKLASKIFDREIIIRDINRFHQFADGFCSCGDYW